MRKYKYFDGFRDFYSQVTSEDIVKFMKKHKASVGYYDDDGGYWCVCTSISESKSKILKYAFVEAMLDHIEEERVTI